MSEIFRHLRPLKFDKSRVTVTPLTNGGVSYMLRPTEQGKYNFWVYICPLDAGFSARAARVRLREVADNGVAPWASIELTESKLIDQLVAATNQSDLPTTLGEMVKHIWLANHAQEIKLKAARQQTNLVKVYEES